MNGIDTKEVRNFYSQSRFVAEPEFSPDPIVWHEQKCAMRQED